VDVYVLLDVLLVILIALFIPIGFWRGAYREAFVTLGILFGASLGRFWGEPWGVELAAVTRLHESGGAFMIAMLCLISATFLLGYSAGAAIPVPDPGWIARVLGALIAGANGALLLSFALRDIHDYLLSSEEAGFLDNAIIAPFLSEGTGWILLVAAAIFVPIALVLALFGPDIEEEYDEEDYEYYDEGEYDPYAERTMQLDQRAPAYAQQQGAPARYTAPAEETRPVPSVHHRGNSGSSQQASSAPVEAQEEYPESEQTPTDDAAATVRRVTEPEETQPLPAQPPANDAEERSENDAEIQDEPESQASPGEPSFGTHSVEEVTDERRIIFGHRPISEDMSETAATPSGSTCPNCQAAVSESDEYCPNCGREL
jgi:uncharacterized membrane protein required for colicin V production